MDHIFDHGDVHVLVHAHDHSSQEKEDDHTSDADSQNHNHNVVKVDLKGVLSNSNILTDQIDLLPYAIAILPETDFLVIIGDEVFLNLPPPDIEHLNYIQLSFSPRPPPIA